MNKEELIELYFLNALDPEQSKQFSMLMETDPDFIQEVKLREDLKIVISVSENESLKENLQRMENKFKYRSYWRYAAAAILIIGLTGLAYFSDLFNTQQSVFQKFFEPYRNTVQPIERSIRNSANLKQRAFFAYESKSYSEAINKFDSILKIEDDPIIQFYKANALLALNKSEVALDLLENYKSEAGEYSEKYQWYLALSYLKMEKFNRAKIMLDSILLSESHYKYEQAKKLKAALD